MAIWLVQSICGLKMILLSVPVFHFSSVSGFFGCQRYTKFPKLVMAFPVSIPLPFTRFVDLRGFDFVIICCSDLSAENYWQELALKGFIFGRFELQKMWMFFSLVWYVTSPSGHLFCERECLFMCRKDSHKRFVKLRGQVQQWSVSMRTETYGGERAGCWIFIANQPTFTKKERPRWVPTRKGFWGLEWWCWKWPGNALCLCKGRRLGMCWSM